MTINEMIKELQKIADEGNGNKVVRNAEGDDVFAITDMEESNNVVIYF